MEKQRNPRYDSALRERVVELYRSGLSLREVGEQLGRSHHRIAVLLDEMDEPRRPVGRRPAAPPETPQDAA